MTARPKLSILLLTYNRQHMLAECLDSLLPTAVDCEIVVLDDASTDNTPQVLADYAARDPRIRSVRQPVNVGVNANVEAAFREARGEYISYFGDDDSAVPGNFETKVAILDARPEVDFVYSPCFAMDEHRIYRQRWDRVEYPDHSYIGGRDEFMDLISGNYIPAIGVVIRRKLYDERGGHDQNMPPMLSDWELWLRYTYKTQTAFIREPLVNVRMHSSGISQERQSEMAIGMITVWRKWLVDRDNPPVLHAWTWRRMYGVFASQVQSCHPDQPQQVQACMEAFRQLHQDATAHATHHFSSMSRELCPLPDLAASALQRGPKLPAILWSGSVFGIGDDSADLRSMELAADGAGLQLRWENVHVEAMSELPPVHGTDSLYRKMWTPLDSQEYVQVCQSAPRYFDKTSKATGRVGRTAWATDRLPDDWAAACNEMDVMWLPTAFQRDIFAESGVQPDTLRILPGCIDLARYSSASSEASLGTGRSFNFLAVLEWAPSSGWDVLIRAFVQEFQPDEDVALMLLTLPPFGQQQDNVVHSIQQVIGSQIGARPTPLISLQLGVLAEPQLASLLRASQAYVQPSRAASWGRSVMQAMASGLPTIATAWGGAAELLTEHNGYPVECRLVDVPQGALPDLRDASGHRWAEPSLEHLQARLREVFTNRDAAAARGQQARSDVAARHDPAAVGVQLRELVAELAGR